MKLLLLGIAIATTACVKQGQTPSTSAPAAARPAPALRDICTDARFNSLCTPVRMPGPVQIDINTAGRQPANPPAFS
jgi:hypothetical protein